MKRDRNISFFIYLDAQLDQAKDQNIYTLYVV